MSDADLTRRQRNAGYVRAHRERHPQVQLSAYRPLDEILKVPAVRILRALRWFDWVDCEDLLLAIDVADWDGDQLERQRHHLALSRLVAKGAIEARGPSQGRTYRITPAGRGEFERRIKRAQFGEGVAA